MKVSYYPGCSLKTEGSNFERSAIAVARELGIELKEMPRWNCCGTVYSLATDDLMHQLAPIRNLIRVQENGDKRVVTLCSMCYNTLKRANLRAKRNPDDLEKMNSFMDEEEDYEGEVEVLHLLELLRGQIGFDAIKGRVTQPLEGLKVVPYYGCMLLRPREAGIDDPERPTILEELLEVLGAEVINDPYKTQCCGSYHTVERPEIVARRAHAILSSAVARGGDVVALSCPLCKFNLDDRQKLVAELYPDFAPIPVLYFTQLMAIAIGLDEEVCEFDQHYVDPRPVLEEKLRFTLNVGGR